MSVVAVVVVVVIEVVVVVIDVVVVVIDVVVASVVVVSFQSNSVRSAGREQSSDGIGKCVVGRSCGLS